MVKKTFRVLFLCLCLGLMLSAAVSANSPPSAELEGGGLTPGSLMIYLFFIILSILLTVLVEWVVSLFFRLEASSTVVLTNVVSQLIMHFLYLVGSLLLFDRIDPNYVIIILEVCVFLGEWGYYAHELVSASKVKLLFFTLTANLLSLFLGGLGIFLIL